MKQAEHKNRYCLAKRTRHRCKMPRDAYRPRLRLEKVKRMAYPFIRASTRGNNCRVSNCRPRAGEIAPRLCPFCNASNVSPNRGGADSLMAFQDCSGVTLLAISGVPACGNRFVEVGLNVAFACDDDPAVLICTASISACS